MATLFGSFLVEFQQCRVATGYKALEALFSYSPLGFGSLGDHRSMVNHIAAFWTMVNSNPSFINIVMLLVFLKYCISKANVVIGLL